MDHWAFGPHHLWSDPDTGNIIRMWQPFNGLQVYPDGVRKFRISVVFIKILILAQSNVDLSVFDDLPPPLCRAGPGGALFRIGCDDDGFPTGDITNTTIPVPTPSPKDVVHGKDIKRAEEKVPRGHYKGVDFAEMSDILNGWLNTSTLTKPCLDWDVEELQQLQALFYLARESQFDDIYIRTGDNRRLRNDVLADLASNWAGLNNIAKTHSDYRYRDHR